MKVRLHAPGGRGRARVQVRCPAGLESLLDDELAAQAVEVVQRYRGGRTIETDVRGAVALCYRSRLASRVLWPLASFEARDGDALYAGASQIDWARHLRGLPTISVGFDGIGGELRNTHFSALRIKDAIVDALREARGERPTVETDAPEIAVQGVLHRGRVTVHLDLAGTPLHRRGWRAEQGEAPLKEHLAAGLLLVGGWREGRREWLCDPCCGAGTLLVEGALIAAGLPPGRLRERFGFEAWHGAPDGLRAELEAGQRRPDGVVRLLGRDIDEAQVARTRRNLERAGAGTDFEVELDLAVGDLSRGLPAVEGACFVVANPPWGERLAAGGALPALGRSLRERGAEVPFALIVGAPKAAGAGAVDGARAAKLQLDLPGVTTHAVRNGPLDAWFVTGVTSEQDVDTTDFVNRVRKNRRRLERVVKRLGTDAWRVYDRDLPDFAFVVDRYGDAAVVQEFRPPATVDPVLAARRRDAALAALPRALDLPPGALRFRQRRRQRGDDGYGVEARTGSRLPVREGDAVLLVNLDDYLDTGLYLDSRGVRRRIATFFADRGGGRFLNLYAYTCTATIQALRGGARESVSVDRSRTYLAWGRENLLANLGEPDDHASLEAHALERADVLPWLEGPGRAAGAFDCVLLDPPTFSNHADDADLDLQRDHPRLLRAALERLAPGGLLLFVVHARRFRLDERAHDAERFEVREITDATLDADCARGRPAHRCWAYSRRPAT